MSLASAILSGDLGELPSRRDEAWRWSDLRGLIRLMPPPSPTGRLAAGAGEFGALDASRMNVVNGFGASPIKVAAGERATVSLRLIAGDEAGAHVSRVSIEVEPGGELVLLETYEGPSQNYVAQTDLSIQVGAGAAVERVVLAGDSAGAVSVSIAEVVLSPGAAYAQTVLTTGAKRQRIETRLIHPGRDAKVRLDGVYLPADRRHADITTLVTHEGPGGDTDQLVKGVARDQARGVFQGRIVVKPGADQTLARMGHHALLLSDRAEVDAKPELEIYADDVSCAHGNTVGALDEEALFYAAQRGIPEARARSMLTAAFVGEVVDRIAHDGARGVARGWVSRQLGGES